MYGATIGSFVHLLLLKCYVQQTQHLHVEPDNGVYSVNGKLELTTNHWWNFDKMHYPYKFLFVGL